MADLCNFAFTGKLGQDAQVKTTPNGKTYMEMSVAINTGYGNYKKTLWAKVKQWGERVNNIAGIFTKGSTVAGNGEVSINEWTGKDGTAHAELEVTCMNVQIISSKKHGTDTDTDTDTDTESESDNPDGIPF